jgi:hypothetical protein
MPFYCDVDGEWMGAEAFQAAEMTFLFTPISISSAAPQRSPRRFSFQDPLEVEGRFQQRKFVQTC